MRFCYALVLTLALGVRLPAQPNLIWPADGQYAGSQKCAICHPAQARSYHASSMFRALEPVDNCEILKRNPHMEWTDGPYHYLLEKTEKGYRYRVTGCLEKRHCLLLYK